MDRCNLSQVEAWGESRPELSGDFRKDREAFVRWHARSETLLEQFAYPASGERREAQQRWRELVAELNGSFLRRHISVLREIVHGRGLEQTLDVVAEELPGFAATRAELDRERERPLADKIGVEYRSAVTLSALLADPLAGDRLIEQERRPSTRATDLLQQLRATDEVRLTGATVHRSGAAALVEICLPRALNSETYAVMEALETCVDLALLDDRIQVCVLRGSHVDSKKYEGRRVFCSGINLSELYEGRLPYLYYVKRELGLVNKIYSGINTGRGHGEIEKPWVAAVDGHAIGGGCQLLLVMDFVIAERGALLSLPARREGIIPGAANLRLSRFLGAAGARAALLLDQQFSAESLDGRKLVDRVVEREDMTTELGASVGDLTSSGLVSLAANRKALRLSHEPRSLFREYMAYFSLAQADCHFSTKLVDNLRTQWVERKTS